VKVSRRNCGGKKGRLKKHGGCDLLQKRMGGKVFRMGKKTYDFQRRLGALTVGHNLDLLRSREPKKA